MCSGASTTRTGYDVVRFTEFEQFGIGLGLGHRACPLQAARELPF